MRDPAAIPATGAFWRSLLAASLFALHPMHVESVAWITERKNVLSGAFALGSALCFLRSLEASDRRFGAAFFEGRRLSSSPRGHGPARTGVHAVTSSPLKAAERKAKKGDDASALRSLPNKIRAEIAEVEAGKASKEDNVLKHAPHTAEVVISDAWNRAYSREKAAFPAPWTRDRKFWPAVSRVDNAFGDRNLVCACPPVEEYA